MRKLLPLLALLLSLNAGAAITSVDSANNGTSGTSINVASGDVTGLADDDVGVGIVFVDDQSASTITSASGFTKEATLEVGDTTGRDRTIAAFHKVASSETGNWTFNQDGAADNMAAVVAVFRGVDTTTPIDVTPIAGHTDTFTNDDTPDPPSITTVTDGAWVIAYCGVNGNSTSHDAVTPPTGYTLFGSEPDPFAASNQRQIVMAYKEVSTAGAEDPGVFTFSGGSTNVQEATCGVIALRPATAGGGPSFSAGPTLSSCSATGCTYDYTASASGDTIYALFLDTAATAPADCNAVETGTGNHGTANESTTGSSDSITVTSTDSPEYPLYDAYFCIEESPDTDSTVSQVLASELAAPTGQQFVEIASIGTDSPCDEFNGLATPDIVAGDWLLATDETAPGGHSLSIAVDCHYSYSAPGDNSQQAALDVAVYDASAGDYHADDIDTWFNNTAPTCNNYEQDTLVLDEDTAMSTVFLDDQTSDFDDDDLSYALTVGTLPTGTSLSGTGDDQWTGTPTTENEAGTALTFEATDTPGDTCTFNGTVYVINTVTMPTITDSDVAAANTDLDASFPWNAGQHNLSQTNLCTDVEASGQVITQDPAASAEASKNPSVTIEVSRGTVCSKTARSVKLPGVGIN